MKSLLEELRRRNVFRALAIYAGAAWLLVQIATQVFPFFDVPNWAVRGVVVVALIGLPVVALLSWFYEFTAEGLKRESDLDPDGEAVRMRSRALDRGSVLALGVVVALLIADIALRHWTPGRGHPQPSIAVMPFKNLGGNADNSYLAGGLQDEILTRLSRIGTLKVISRTSTAYYAAQPADLRKIAQELGVTHIIEGSVQRNENSARISIQLIAAETDSNLWAETYDRQLTDIFIVESEVATAIADALQAHLTGAQKQDLASVTTQNPQAYDAYLHGLAFNLRSLEPGNLASSASWLGKAVELDPDFALAWALLARVDANRAFYGFDRAQRPCEQARHAADSAFRLQPELGETDLAQGYVRFMCDDDMKGAEDAFTKALTRLPNNADVLRAISQIEWRKGNLPAVLSRLQAAEQLDPRNAELLSTHALYLSIDRQFAAARATVDRALEINPDDASLTALQASIHQAEGDLDAAQKQLDRLPPHPSEADAFVSQMLQLIYRGRYSDAIRALNAALATDLSGIGVGIGDYYYLLANAQTASGQAAAARRTFIKAHQVLQQHDTTRAQDNSSAGTYLRGMLCLTAVGSDPAALNGEDCLRLRHITESDSQFAFSSLDTLAQSEVLAGDRDAALATLTRLLESRYSSVRYTTPLTPALLRLDPIWSPLRDQARFQVLAEIVKG